MLHYIGEVRHPRRHALIKRIAARDRGDTDLELMWQAKQQQIAGVALPDGFPCRSRLNAVGYVAAEDLDGALEDELMETVELSRLEAKAVLAALALI